MFLSLGTDGGRQLRYHLEEAREDLGASRTGDVVGVTFGLSAGAGGGVHLIGRNCFLVTGAQGFIGSWVIKNMLDMEHEVIAYDVHARPVRLSLLLPPQKLRKIHFVRGDINNLGQIKMLLEKRAVTHVIHLAGLQTPECRAKPILGAAINVVGTLTLFEAIKAYKDQVKCVVYASSGAVLGTDEAYGSHPIEDDAPRVPGTLYGVFKAANEECARIYWQDEGIRSVASGPRWYMALVGTKD